jgi:hypothetical protein
MIDTSDILYLKRGMDITGEVVIELLKLDAAANNKKEESYCVGYHLTIDNDYDFKS